MTLSALGIFSAAGAGVVSAGAYELIETYVLGSSQSAITFSSLATYSSTYKHLQVRMTARTDRGGTVSDSIKMEFNGDTSASNYALHVLQGNGSSVGSGGYANNAIELQRATTTSDAANSFGFIVVDVLDAYAAKNKTVRGLGGFLASSDRVICLTSGLWKNTASLTSMTFRPGGGSNLVSGTRMSLYGIR
jgi:hypothetical protein